MAKIVSSRTPRLPLTPATELLWCICQKSVDWEFPGGPVVKTPCFHCSEQEFYPWSGNKDAISPAMWPKKKSYS